MTDRRRFFPATPVQRVPGRTVELEMQLRAVPAAVPAATAAELPRFVADLWREGDQLMVLYSDGDTAAIDLCCAPAQDVTLWWANEYPGEPPAGYSAAASGSYNATAPGMPPTLDSGVSLRFTVVVDGAPAAEPPAGYTLELMQWDGSPLASAELHQDGAERWLSLGPADSAVTGGVSIVLRAPAGDVAGRLDVMHVEHWDYYDQLNWYAWTNASAPTPPFPGL